MTMPVRRRSLLAAGLLSPLASTSGTGVHFTLHAETLDGGEQVTSLVLDTSRVGPIDPASLSADSFDVHARAVNPLPGTEIYGEYDLDRVVTGVRLDDRGRIVIALSTAEGQPGGATLGYLAAGRNVRFELTYTITQVAPVRLRGGRWVRFSPFVQGRLVNREVDAFSYHTSRSGLKYRLRSSPTGGRRPLIVWLHGGGEGALLPYGYYDNETTLRANRGALGFATAQGQHIFGGAHVVAPQSTSYWMEDGPRFAPLIREVIAEVTRTRAVDTDRIHVVGCSNGGYMSIFMTTAYPSLFASSLPICGVVEGLVPDDALAAIRTPTWLVTSRDDTTVDPGANTLHAHSLIPDSRLTLYDNVTWNGYRYPGHWSWIYVARNDRDYWQWMSRNSQDSRLRPR